MNIDNKEKTSLSQIIKKDINQTCAIVDAFNYKIMFAIKMKIEKFYRLKGKFMFPVKL